MKGIDGITLGSVLLHYRDVINKTIGIHHALFLIYANPVEASLIGVSDIGIGGPRTITHALVEDEVEVLVEGPLTLVEMVLVGRLVVGVHMLAINIPFE